MSDKDKNGRKRESYPTRGMTLSDEAWDQLKTAKLKHGGTWTQFIKELLKQKP